jgi:DNA replication protein DnaC
VAAIGHALIDTGRRVLFCSTTDMVQKLQAARRASMSSCPGLTRKSQADAQHGSEAPLTVQRRERARQ